MVSVTRTGDNPSEHDEHEHVTDGARKGLTVGSLRAIVEDDVVVPSTATALV